MDQVFEPRGYIQVPDETYVSPFLNASDESQPDVPWGALGDMSIAAGRIDPGVSSWIHIHPAVHQVTYLLSGQLTIRMKEPDGGEPYALHLRSGQAAVSEPGTLFQLSNTSGAVAHILYIVSPSYVFEIDGQTIVHDDSIMVAQSWEELAAADYNVPALKVTSYEATATRAEAWRRLAARKGHHPRPLADEDVHTLPELYDYLAPDNSEIRLAATGEHGGLAHCTLPAGTVSAAVRHRTVEELWYVLEGQGTIWRRRGDEQREDRVAPGDSIRIPVGVSFQFRAASDSDLKLLLATMPPWPGEQEAVSTEGKWTS